MLFQQWSGALGDSFQGLYPAVVFFAANLIAAIIIFVVGWIVGAFISSLIQKAFRALKVDHALRQAGLERALHRGGITLDSGAFVGGLVKWFVIVLFLISSLQVLGLTQVTAFLSNVVSNYIPQVIVSVLILLVAVVIAEAVQKIVRASAGAAGITGASALGTIARWAILIFAVLAALIQLGIAVTLIQTLFMGVVIALSLAFGLAFGLGGQQAASETIAKIKAQISDR
ncbi:MAG: hypothetical protein PHF79_03990 [Candidatus Pacebacteria bacterium]|nr:hypothetical protein [Candidatus Paceibacterota bacterium]